MAASILHKLRMVLQPPTPNFTLASLKEEELEKEEEEDMELQESEHVHALPSPTHQTFYLPSNYSLSSGASHSTRSPSHVSFSVSSRSNHQACNSSSTSSTFASCHHKSPWQEDLHVDHDVDLPSISPSDHIKTLLSQLASSISSMKGAFAHLQATIRTYGAEHGSMAVLSSLSPAERVMEEELQRLSDVHMHLYSVLREQRDMADNRNGSHDSMFTQEDMCSNADSMLKSYEGIISRFHDEIRKKEAVEEALKETLAKSMLKGEKLERRIKSLELKLTLK